MFRIALLLKGKGSGGMAPPFLQMGGASESEDELKLPLQGPGGTLGLGSVLDSDDGVFLTTLKCWLHF